MQFFIQKSISSIQQDGKKKTSFKIMKGTNDKIHQIKGMSSDNNPNIYTIIEDRSHKNNGKIITKHKEFKIKSSNIQKLLKESDNNKNKNKTQEIKSIPIKKSVKTNKKNIKIDIKKIYDTPIKKNTVNKKIAEKPIKKVVKDNKKVAEKPIKKVVKKNNVKDNKTVAKKPIKKIVKKVLKDNISKEKNIKVTKKVKNNKNSKSNLK
jgi:hypothetical protein